MVGFDLAGYWSRRIDQEHRLVYTIQDGEIVILALTLADTGREREALSLALAALAPHLPRYQRSLTNYARDLTAPHHPTNEPTD